MERIIVKQKMSETNETLRRRVMRVLNFKNFPVIVDVVSEGQAETLLKELVLIGHRRGEVIARWQCSER